MMKKVKRNTKLLLRKFFECLGVGILSKPYPHHEILNKYINKKNGFYIVGGGNDGLTQDPTYFLEKIKGWKGVIVEPLPIYKMCQKNRPKSKVINSALVSKKTSEKIKMINCNLMSVVKDSTLSNKSYIEEGEKIQNIKSEEIEVNTITLNEIFQEALETVDLVDLLVLDIEGYESEALKGIDFDIYQPQHILVEILNSENKNEIEKIISKYILVANLGQNDYLYKLDK